MKKRVWLVAVMAAFGVACSGSSGSDSGSINLSVNALTREDITRVAVEISGPGMAAMQADLVKYGDLWTGVVGQIPAGADRAVVARAYDAGGTLLYEGSVAGVEVVADQVSSVWILLQQVAAPPPFVNAPPRIQSLYASTLEIVPGRTAQFTVNAVDPNGDPLTYAWSSSDGVFAPADAAVTTWTSPGYDGDFQITVRVSDPDGATAEASFWVHVRNANATGRLQIEAELNTWPVVANLIVSPSRVLPGETTNVTVSVGDPDGDALELLWTADCAGVFGGPGPVTTFTPTEQPLSGECTIAVEARDGRGGVTTGATVLYVAAPVAVDSAPVITQTFQSLLLAAPGTPVVLRAEANDPEGGPVTFSWAATGGTLSAPVDGSGTSELVWTVPGCGVPAEVTVTVTDLTGLATSYVFTVDSCTEIKVAVATGGWYTDELRAFLDANPNFVATNVNTCDLATLSQFDVVWLYGNMYCYDEVAFTAYAAAGGGLIATPWILVNNNGFDALPAYRANWSPVFSTPLDVSVTDPADPLLDGVGFVNGDAVGRERETVARPGAAVAAIWNDDGSPAVASWAYGAGRVVYLNLHYITSDTSRAIAYGWGQQLAANAVRWAAGAQ